MRAEWLKRAGAEELIVVLTGWAVGPEPFRHLAGPADVLVLSDYRDLTPPDWPRGYAAMDLVAWSFGVAAACRLPGLDLFRRKVAACGSWAPCDDDLGIPRDVVRATAENLSPAALRKFGRRAGCAVAAGADPAALREELQAVMGWDAGQVPGFDRIWLGAADRIFALRNLRRAWQGWPVEMRVLDRGHNPFAQWRDWAEVLA
ncbi:pimeloyl-ACP methyl esterase BioG family protein [Paracoccus sp. P2]|uniref:DUF452 family protein n=1 Tax=Paracoccus pantotrophus TaxID=82367 RepID=A0A7H9BNU2_PARPN|nr:pimeloyl-ACP methyl esterase BioG family protein [Paracoccus pantotrophus]MDF3853710.1 DUF452 family protein [Paracoccus pantotrophus]QLH12872.1 DUF452 family protein [Paracoccus pantotrophus]RDD93697.1 DUF452 family protein [Paracoccus pantotrophus]RNI14742.1 DUF452 family protein [Paracoccus pantotrophus]WGR66484.1 DUF452 family protein [Paracoccus pantotrophus]